ncbi:MAG: HAMP domain-containing histidine kinase [Bacteroidetes bacterium]|nr:HAMP domain-containing histidine kinase [Bacteroidota bacterium]
MKNQDIDSADNRQLLVWVSFSVFIISMLSILVNYQIEIDTPLMHISYTALIIYLILSILIKRGLNLIISQHLIIIISLIFTNLLWFYEYGHHGPVLFIFVLIFALSIFIWQGKKLIISTIILLINLSVCFYIEFTYRDLIVDYQDKTTKIIDVYSSIFMLLIIFYALMMAVKKSYSREYEKALQSDKLKSSFLENINHEVRTPLNAIVGFSSLLNEDDITPEQRKDYSTLIMESNDALLRIIDDILLVSTLESNDATINVRYCNLDDVINGLHKTFSEALVKIKKHNSIALYVSEPNVSAIIETDKIRIQQVFIRLMDNAIKFTDSGKINFGYRVEQDTILFHIADTGTGIKKKFHSKIFDRFYKVNADEEELFKGTGIGLFITKKIVESLNGEIWLSSIFGSGTTFYFSIPKTGYKENNLS